MSTCTDEKRPILWQQQPRIPISAQRCLRQWLEAALEDPRDRGLLVWPVLLGAPRFLAEHPEGIPLALLLEKAAPMLRSLDDATDVNAAFRACLNRFPTTAIKGASGWLPHPEWVAYGDWLSLRSGVLLMALMGLPLDERYRLHAGVALFNEALFHECHDALEGLWKVSRGRLRSGLQGLIFMAGGYHHQQMQNPSGMQSLWRSALESLLPLDGQLNTPWGLVAIGDALETCATRLAWLDEQAAETDLEGLWRLPRPILEVSCDA